MNAAAALQAPRSEAPQPDGFQFGARARAGEVPVLGTPRLVATDAVDRSSARLRRWAPAFLCLIAFWPVWQWYALRMADGSDEPWGLLALGSAVFFALWLPGAPSASRGRCSVFLGALAFYAVSFPFVPPLARALLAVVALGSLCGGNAGAAGLAGLLALSLPVIATAQFFLGYPLRVLAAESTALVVNAAGWEVTRAGTSLCFGGETILVDAPCSGVRMLWAGLFVACLLATHLRLSAGKAVFLATGTAGIVVLANVARSTALFFKEAGITTLPDWTHAGIGLLIFTGALVGIVAVARRLGPGICNTGLCRVKRRADPTAHLPWWSAAALCAAAALMPLIGRSTPARALDSAAAFPGWPAAFENRPLREVALSDRDARFSADFPGRIARFTDGRRELIVRWISAPTRKLHSSADCFRALGSAITPLPARLDSRGVSWSSFAARHGDREMLVRERIFDEAEGAWTDVSAWFWSALLQRTRGPWWAITVVEPM